MGLREQMLATVEGSPAAVAAHDKQRWLSLFAPDAIVNDPVGSSPHRGDEHLSRFYDTFIAPNTIVFHPAHDIVCGDTVIRDLTLEIRMSDAVTLTVPVHLRYEMASADLIAGLFAHWELPTMVRQLLAEGVDALPISTRLTGALLRNQGLGGAAGFARGFVRAGAAEKRRTLAFLDAACGGRSGSDVRVEYGAGRVGPVADLRDELDGWRTSKCLAAGRYVTVSLTRGEEHAVAMATFERRQIVAMKVYVAS
ncbi:nuclear transport factor 2 family protein [Gordonia sp. PS3]|uniref:nuclear transport factor 2 family protein n=1 Tax=unclassified Gordonia (in: high G+C Gram-positive bacteria) TaxID=2657482 RepID=UPI0035C0C6CB